ncbi:Sec7 domain protein [Gregarina niphandrodes]|uniref:Sec7 domain protein n=1 Tax=Gregarina niphandrodes TaxID=110365 RepID=A0A023B5L1_GRENI|nr:Sec7 domain protein [Gregarina niphandrodes]EZG61128.1 Sec7 domain protein [Gregarina niphandrodes]|eukprot:XP_011130781.1 Sec7 domain protein [Gregarina niphandrodes]
MEYFRSRRDIICANVKSLLSLGFQDHDFGCAATGCIVRDLGRDVWSLKELTDSFQRTPKLSRNKSYHRFTIHDLGCTDYKTLVLKRPTNTAILDYCSDYGALSEKGLLPSAKHHAFIALLNSYRSHFDSLVTFLKELPNSELIWLFCQEGDLQRTRVCNANYTAHWNFDKVPVSDIQYSPTDSNSTTSSLVTGTPTFTGKLLVLYVNTFIEAFCACIDAFNHDPERGLKALEVLGVLQQQEPQTSRPQVGRSQIGRPAVARPTKQKGQRELASAPPTGQLPQTGQLPEEDGRRNNETRNRRKTLNVDKYLTVKLKFNSPSRPRLMDDVDTLLVPIASYEMQVAYFMISTPCLYPNSVHSCCSKNPTILRHFANLFDFVDLDLATALRFFTSHYLLTGESQDVYAAIEAFGRSYAGTIIREAYARSNHAHGLFGSLEEKVDLSALLENHSLLAQEKHGSISLFQWARKRRSSRQMERKSPRMLMSRLRKQQELIGGQELEALEDTVIAVSYALLMVHTSRKLKLMDVAEFRSMTHKAAAIPLSDQFLDNIYQNVLHYPLQYLLNPLLQYGPRYVDALRHVPNENDSRGGGVMCYRLRDAHRYHRRALTVSGGVLHICNAKGSGHKVDDSSKHSLSVSNLVGVALLTEERMARLAPGTVGKLAAAPRHMVLQLIKADLKEETFIVEDYSTQTSAIIKLLAALQKLVQMNKTTLSKINVQNQIKTICLLHLHRRDIDGTKDDYLKMLNALRYNADMPLATEIFTKIQAKGRLTVLPTPWHYMYWVGCMKNRCEGDAGYATSQATTDNLLQHLMSWRQQALTDDRRLALLSTADWDVQTRTSMGLLMLMPAGALAVSKAGRHHLRERELAVVHLTHGSVMVQGATAVFPTTDLSSLVKITDQGMLVCISPYNDIVADSGVISRRPVSQTPTNNKLSDKLSFLTELAHGVSEKVCSNNENGQYPRQFADESIPSCGPAPLCVVIAAQLLLYFHDQKILTDPGLPDIYLATWLIATLDYKNPVDLRLIISFFVYRTRLLRNYPLNSCNLQTIMKATFPVTVDTWTLLNVDYETTFDRWKNALFVCAIPLTGLCQTWNDLLEGKVTYIDLIRKLVKALTLNDSVCSARGYSDLRRNVEAIFWNAASAGHSATS